MNAIKEPDLSKSIQAVEDTIADYDVLVLPGFNYAACADIATANPVNILYGRLCSDRFRG